MQLLMSIRQHARHAVTGWLMHYVISRKVASSIPDEVVRFFN
jgi:hypothetical protein